MLNISKLRDLTIMEYNNKKLVIACDSCGGIGPKSMDCVSVSAYILGRFLARTALMELLSIGATPLAIIDPLSVEMKPTGEEIICGIRDEAGEIGFNTSAGLNGSTEDNIRTVQTGAGIVVIGEADDLKASSSPNDLLVCIGYPKVGPEVNIEDEEICTPSTVKTLLEVYEVREIVPVGSKGIRYEIEALLERNQLAVHYNQTDLPMTKSAGPSTCILVSLADSGLPKLQSIKQPIQIIGRLIGKRLTS
ncbi:MAG TPA: hypothetical protein VJ824_10665 [Bacillota bacterium]|nr:hypothetical protein [Bacillota bacterium]